MKLWNFIAHLKSRKNRPPDSGGRVVLVYGWRWWNAQQGERMSSCCSQLSYLSIYHWMSQCPSLQRPAGAPWLAAVRSAVSRTRTCLARTLSWDQRPSAAWAWLVNGTLSHCSPAQCPPLPTLPCEDLIWCLSEHNHYSDTRPICLQEQSERIYCYTVQSSAWSHPHFCSNIMFVYDGVFTTML